MKNTLQSNSKKTITGFTLLEVLVVIAVIGLIISTVQLNFSGKRPGDILKQSSIRFAGVFDTAANYGLLNNVELGLYVKDHSYQFLGFDGEQWQVLDDHPWLALQELPAGVELTLTLDDLPIEEPMLFDSSVFTEQNNEYLSFDDREDKKEKKLIPQVYLLSGGDITPFSLTFHFDEQTVRDQDLDELAYRVTGLYSTPLTIEGPVLDDE